MGRLCVTRAEEAELGSNTIHGRSFCLWRRIFPNISLSSPCLGSFLRRVVRSSRPIQMFVSYNPGFQEFHFFHAIFFCRLSCSFPTHPCCLCLGACRLLVGGDASCSPCMTSPFLNTPNGFLKHPCEAAPRDGLSLARCLVRRVSWRSQKPHVDKS